MNFKLIPIFSLLLLSSPSQAQKVAKSKSNASISVSIGNSKPGDTLFLELWADGLSRYNVVPSYKTLVSTAIGGSCHFTIEGIVQPVYFCVGKQRVASHNLQPILGDYLVEPGDSVNIQIDSIHVVKANTGPNSMPIDRLIVGSISFSGRAAAKYQYLYQSRADTELWDEFKLFMAKRNKTTYAAVIDSLYLMNFPTRILNSNWQEMLYALQSYSLDIYKNRMSNAAYQILKADLIGGIQEQKVRFLGYDLYTIKSSKGVLTEATKRTLQNKVIEAFLEKPKIPINTIPVKFLSLSSKYIFYLSKEARLAEKLFNQEPYSFIKKTYSGSLRDRVLTNYLLSNLTDLELSPDSVLNDAIATVKNSYCQKLLINMRNNYKIGSTAYNFSLPDANGKIVKLSDFKGKFVFIDVWYVGCAGCKGFYEASLSNVEKHFSNNPNIIFVTVSIDKVKESWLDRMHYYTSLDSPNVINLYTGGMGTEHPFIKNMNINAYPALFLIDKEGKIYKTNDLQVESTKLIEIINEALQK